MRLIVITSIFPSDDEPTLGIFVKEQLKKIMQQCTLVAVISPRPWKPGRQRPGNNYAGMNLGGDEQLAGVPIYRPRFFMIPKATVYLNWFFYFVSVYWLIRKRGLVDKFDIVHAHFAYPEGMVAGLLSKLLKKPAILTVRGLDINQFPKDPILKKCITFALKSVASVIAVSETLKQKVMALGPPDEKVNVIPNGIDLNIFKPISKAMAREKIGLEMSNQMVLFVGALIPRKGVDYLIQGFRDALDLVPTSTTVLVLVGSGPMKSQLQALSDRLGIVDRIVWKPFISHDEIPLWMSASDVLCLTSHSEGRPNVLYEAMACGRPVVATNVDGNPEIVCSSDLGQLVPAGDSSEITKALVQVLNHSWDPEQIRGYALKQSSTVHATSIVNIYEKCLQQP